MPHRFPLAIMACVLWLAASGCATQPTARPAPTPAGRAPSDTDYPAWAKAAGWLLVPFTGASHSVDF